MNEISEKGNTGKSGGGMFAVLVASALVGIINETLMNVSLISVAEELDISSGLAQWLITGYMLVTAIMVPVAAFLYQSILTKRLHMLATGVILIGAVGCYFSSLFPLLLFFRMLQAAGTGMLIPIMMNVTLETTPKEQVASKLAICNCAVFLGPALGPIVTGVVMHFFTWRACFLLMAVAGGVLLLLSGLTVKNISGSKKTRIDIPSVFLCTSGLVVFLYGISVIIDKGFTAVIMIAAGAVILGVFVRRQTKLETPILNFSPMKNRRFVTGAILSLLSMMVLFSLNALLPSYYQGALGTTTMMSALLLMPGVLLNAVSTILSGRIIDRKSVKSMLPAGFFVICAGLLIFSFCSTGTSLIILILILIITYQGLAFTMSPAQTTALSAVEPDLYPHGVSLVNTGLQVSAAIGSSLFGGIMAVVKESSLSRGAAENAAVASGFSSAVKAAAVIAAAGFVIAAVFDFKMFNSKK